MARTEPGEPGRAGAPSSIARGPYNGTTRDWEFTPSVHVAADATVGVRYYDFRFNTAGGGTATDHFLAHCHAACTSAASWVENETRVTPASFDSRRAPVARGLFLGDYVGLDNIGNRFTPFFTQATASERANGYFATVARRSPGFIDQPRPSGRGCSTPGAG